MSRFGKTLFGGSRFIFWVLGSALLLFAIGLSAVELTRDNRSFGSTGLVMIAVATSLLLLIGLYNPVRFRWALRCVTGVVFLTYIGYLIYMVVVEQKSFTWLGNRADTSPTNALFGLLIIGLPCLWYTLTGRLTIRRSKEDGNEHYERGGT
jgi:hypothetical protein